MKPANPIWSDLRAAVRAATATDLAVQDVSLYQICEITGSIDAVDVVGYFNPDFIYVLDVGRPRLAVVTASYILPHIETPTGAQPLGWGDAGFPRLKGARVFSAGRTSDSELLLAAVAGELFISAKAGVSETDLRLALSGFVRSLKASGSHYLAEIDPFNEYVAAAEICRHVEAVASAEPNLTLRDQTGRWQVRRVL